MRSKLKLLVEKFSEAWTACMLCMVQGDLTVISLDHAFTASKTGILSGVGLVAASYLPYDKPIVGVWLTGVIVVIADYICGWSPNIIGPLCTGLGAMGIAYVYYKVKGHGSS